eukprot:283310-Chlamydomonas_euryale.AAC.9
MQRRLPTSERGVRTARLRRAQGGASYMHGESPRPGRGFSGARASPRLLAYRRRWGMPLRTASPSWQHHYTHCVCATHMFTHTIITYDESQPTYMLAESLVRLPCLTSLLLFNTLSCFVKHRAYSMWASDMHTTAKASRHPLQQADSLRRRLALQDDARRATHQVGMLCNH